MAESLLEGAKQQRDLVLLAEFGAWLHDLGKLSRGFIESKTDSAYGEEQEDEAPEPAADPCAKPGKCGIAPEVKWVHGCVLVYDKKSIDAAKLGERLEAAHPTSLGELKLADLVGEHHRKQKHPSHILALFKAADRNESAEDEYNAAGLAQTAPVQRATVFGYEEKLPLDELDELRRGLYDKLGVPDVGGSFDRDATWNVLSEAFQRGAGKTQRAANDVRLDQHVWGVASRFKAFVLRDLLNPPANGEVRNTFRILTVQWDSWEAISAFARLSDVAGRAALLDRLRQVLRNAVETEYAIGNRIYEDDDGIHFMVADVKWGDELEALVRRIANDVSGGEVLPVVKVSETTEHVTDLAQQMAMARLELPVVGAPQWIEDWEGRQGASVCPVCHRRPLEKDQTLCLWCTEQHRGGAGARRGRSGTLQTGEIADDRGKVALIVARFDLERWLRGELLHTLFITSPADIALGERIKDAVTSVWDWDRLREGLQDPTAGAVELKSFQDQVQTAKGKLDSACARQGNARKDGDAAVVERLGQEAREWNTRWRELRQQPISPAAGLTGYLTKYGRLDKACAVANSLPVPPGVDATLLALVRKNPSAGRLLRVWQTTEEFLNAQAQALQQAVGAERSRAVICLTGGCPNEGYATAELAGLGAMEVLVDHVGAIRTTTAVTREQIDRLKHAVGASLTLRGNEAKDSGAFRIAGVMEERYLPYQVITVSPNLLLAMVPADRAAEITRTLQAAYAGEFGKVQGRLPFHVGLVYMDAHYPMFAALDAARRLAESFDALSTQWVTAQVTTIEEAGDGDGKDYTLQLRSERFGSWRWEVNARLGNGAPDFYHPYLLVAQGEALEQRGMSLLGPQGRWVHVSQVQVGDTVRFLPNLFDFLALDTVSRRLEAHLDPEHRDRRPHPLLGSRHGPRPYLLERAGRLAEIWEAIRAVPGMTESRLQAVTTLLAQKWEAWGLARTAGGATSPPYDWLVEQVVRQDFNGSALIKEAILDGSYFDGVELYRHILKEPVSER